MKCIQDRPDLPLYAVTHEITKGGKCLPVHRCARGTTSLESFHRHYNTFIPGTSANAVNFQAYLLDGITRWNASRKQAAVSSSLSLSLPSQSNLSSTIPSIRSFDIELISKVNDLNQKVHGKVLISLEVPNKYTGEAIGLEFLYREAGMTFHSEDLDEQIDEGFHEVVTELTENEEENSNSFPPEQNEDDILEDITGDDESADNSGDDTMRDQDALAKALINLNGLSVSNSDAEKVIKLYNDLDDYDKKPLIYQSVVKKPSTGRFTRSKKRSGHVGLVAMKRCFISAGSPALPPSRSRLVEAICIRLCEYITQPKTEFRPNGRKLYTF